MFTIETEYNQAALTAMARVLRKTVRKKKTMRSHVLGGLVIVLGILLILVRETFDTKALGTLLVILLVSVVLCLEDSINGYIARRRGIPGMKNAVTAFFEEGYHSKTAIGESSFPYTTILHFVRCGNYFVFVFGQSHGQVYDARSISGGTLEEFIAFIEKNTGKSMEIVR